MQNKEKAAILAIVNAASDINVDNKNHISAAIRNASSQQIFRDTEFGRRYLHRLNELRLGSAGNTCKCILCGKQEASLVCKSCLDQLLPVLQKKLGTREAQAIKEDKVTEKNSPQDRNADTEKKTAQQVNRSEESSHTHADWLMDELIQNIDSSMEHLANQNTVRKIYAGIRLLYVLYALNLLGIILLIFMVRGLLT